jgi:hypothetical protein
MESPLWIAAAMMALVCPQALGCGKAAPADETGPSCPAFSYIRGDACVPLPAFSDATVPSIADDSSTPDGDSSSSADGDAESTEAGPREVPPVCTYDGASLAVGDAGTSGPWITGTEFSVSRLAHDSQGNVVALGSSSTQSFFLAKFDPSGAALWTVPVRGTSDVHPEGIAADPAGSVVVVGTTVKSNVIVDFGGGPLPAGGFVVKYDRDGRLLFQKMFPMADNGSSFPWMSQVRVLASAGPKRLGRRGDLSSRTDQRPFARQLHQRQALAREHGRNA